MKTYISALFASLLFVNIALANTPSLIPAPPQIAATSYILIDANSGKVIVENKSEERLAPASLTKIMTAYVANYELQEGNIRMDDQVVVSNNAWAQKFPGSSVMFLEPGKPVTVEQLLKGVDIASGNDATVALAEHIAGSERAFVDLMNQHAQLLGLKNSHFVNPHGLTHDDHYSSAKDMATLAQAVIRDYPEGYKIYAEKEFVYNNIRQPNRNRLLWRDSTIDGLKTGHTDKAGYCLVASAVRDDMRLIAVVMGTRSDEARFQETQKLFSYGYRFYKTVHVHPKTRELAQLQVWGGQQDTVGVLVNKDIYVTVPRAQENALKIDLELDKFLEAGVVKGQVVGELLVKLGDEVIERHSVIAAETVEKGGIFTVLWSKVRLLIAKIGG